MDIFNISSLLLYFVIYSFLGWLIESIYKSILIKEWVNSGFLNIPICPIYGFGALIMELTLGRYIDNIFVLFLLGMIILTIWEYVIGFLLEKVYKIKYWDYSKMKYNIKGRVCLTHSIYWGILGVMFTKFIHPNISYYVSNNITNNAILTISIIFILIVILDFVYASIKIFKLNNLMKKLEGYKVNISIYSEQLKNKVIENNNYKKLNSKVLELRMLREKLIVDLNKKTKRLFKAFPTINSKTIRKYLETKEK